MADGGIEAVRGGTGLPPSSKKVRHAPPGKFFLAGPFNQPSNASSDDSGVNAAVGAGRPAGPFPGTTPGRSAQSAGLLHTDNAAPCCGTHRTAEGLGGGASHLCSTVAIPPCMPSQVGHDIIYGFDKLRTLLRPLHPYFNDKQGSILEFAQYKHSEDDEYSLLYPRVKTDTGSRWNPYRKYQLARSHAGRNVGQLNGVVEANGLDDLRATVLCFTVPGELSMALSDLGAKGRAMIKAAHKKCMNEDLPRVLGLSGILGSLNNLHTWKTKKPLEPHYHVHSVLLNYQLVGARYTEGKRGGGKLDGGDLRKWFGRGIKKTLTINGESAAGSYAFSSLELEELKKAWLVRVKAMCRRGGLSGYLKMLKESDVVTVDEETSEDYSDAAVEYEKLNLHVSRSVMWREGANLHKFINKIVYQKRSWVEDYARYSNKHTDCASPPAWLENYDNRSVPLGWWTNISEYGGSDDGDGERISPFTGKPMIRDGIATVYSVLRKNNLNVGGMAIIRGEAKHFTLCPDELKWLVGASHFKITPEQVGLT